MNQYLVNLGICYMIVEATSALEAWIDTISSNRFALEDLLFLDKDELRDKLKNMRVSSLQITPYDNIFQLIFFA